MTIAQLGESLAVLAAWLGSLWKRRASSHRNYLQDQSAGVTLGAVRHQRCGAEKKRYGRTLLDALPHPVLFCLTQTRHTLSVTPAQEISLF